MVYPCAVLNFISNSNVHLQNLLSSSRLAFFIPLQQDCADKRQTMDKGIAKLCNTKPLTTERFALPSNPHAVDRCGL